MAFWLASKRDGQASDWIQRFDPRFWTVNFPRPAVASVVTTDVDALRVDVRFLREGDLAGLIWDSADQHDHPLLAYAAQHDYSRCTLSFRWRSSGIIALDANDGPTLTIEGRDASGNPHTWYVRLWNYAAGSPEDAQVTIAFSDMAGGWDIAVDPDPVWPGDIDRMFVSLAPPGYLAASEAALAAPVDGWVEMSEIRCKGERAMLEIGDVVVPPHGLAIATGYDDNGVQTPARLLRNIRQLGYRGSVVHYVGMSHYFRLVNSGEAYLLDTTGEPLCKAARSWHRAFFAECIRLGFSPVASLSYEVLDQHCPDDWKQRDHGGNPALTGWDPPSTLLSPANPQAMTWLQSAAVSFVGLMSEAGAPVRFQVGEPWWWTFPDGRICLYDAAAVSAFGGSPATIGDMRQPLDAGQNALLDAAGTLLAQSTQALVQAVRDAAAPGTAEALLLVFSPTLLDPQMPEMRRANLPTGWATPAFDRLQVEDYDWLTSGADAWRRSAYATIDARLGYPADQQDYLAGFVLNREDRDQWRSIDAGIDESLARDPHEIVVWALPQVCRDGFVRLPATQDDTDMQAFDDIQYPLALGRDATVIPEFSTSVSVTASGFERRNSLWSNARLRFDVGPGIRSDAELGELIAFYRARRGPARGFRLRDPSDYSSCGMVAAPTPSDQLLGSGDGLISDFPLVKRYGTGDAQQVRRITRPIFDTLIVSVDGALQVGNWQLSNGGVVSFDAPPATGAQVSAGYLFDVPVRFAQDSLEISGASFAAGNAPSVPVVEIREAS